MIKNCLRMQPYKRRLSKWAKQPTSSQVKLRPTVANFRQCRRLQHVQTFTSSSYFRELHYKFINGTLPDPALNSVGVTTASVYKLRSMDQRGIHPHLSCPPTKCASQAGAISCGVLPHSTMPVLSCIALHLGSSDMLRSTTYQFCHAYRKLRREFTTRRQLLSSQG